MSELAELIAQTEAMLDEVKAEKARIFRERMAKAAADRAAAGIELPPVEHLNPIERARKNPNSLKMAIAANCWECQGRDADPHPRWRIGNCVSTDCPLWPHRPSPENLPDADPRIDPVDDQRHQRGR